MNIKAQWIGVLLLVPLLVDSVLGFGLINLRNQKPSQRNADVYEELKERRNQVLDAEDRIRHGGPILFTEKEKAVNEIFMKIKDEEVNRGLEDSSQFLASHHFFRVKERIEQSEIYKIIKMIPKAMLHGHNTAMVSSEWFVRNLCYRPGLMIYVTDKNVTRLTFREPAAYKWNYVADLRRDSGDARKFDQQLESHISLYTPQPEIDYPDIDVVWRRFQSIFETIKDVIRYLPTFIDFHYQMLQELYDDNVMYAEIRSGMGELYDEADRVYSPADSVQVLKDVVREFKRKNPRFMGIKLIYSIGRYMEPGWEDYNRFKEIQ